MPKEGLNKKKSVLKIFKKSIKFGIEVAEAINTVRDLKYEGHEVAIRKEEIEKATLLIFRMAVYKGLMSVAGLSEYSNFLIKQLIKKHFGIAHNNPKPPQ